MRKKIIVGNWKMNKTPSETIGLINEIKEKNPAPDCDVVVCTPFVCLSNAVETAKGTNIKVGAQNLYFEDKGAYTGEVSADMLKDLGVEYVIIGHSERRQYFNETDITVNKKVIKALEKDLLPILCVGETLTDREQGVTDDVIRRQTKIAFLNVSKEDAKKVIIAYEPVWAIGTGKTATPEQANEVCAMIRDCIETLYDKDTADALRIQYGGSMNAGNAKELLSKPDIDGGLIGGAALKSDDFTTIIKSC